ncbi:hypothetical protein EYF80_027807 [Liparis tanakae]|uniref:Uncharacterized protein n=1 Tax=Liparis tanakae TaxID=230148 RepID=A0A4Z2HB16_9TELE|nr:hypothetical protein EYF80_027807 [Liparis tanakae]
MEARPFILSRWCCVIRESSSISSRTLRAQSRTCVLSIRSWTMPSFSSSLIRSVSLGEDTAGSYDNNCRLSLGKATRDWESEEREMVQKEARVRRSSASGSSVASLRFSKLILSLGLWFQANSTASWKKSSTSGIKSSSSVGSETKTFSLLLDHAPAFRIFMLTESAAGGTHRDVAHSRLKRLNKVSSCSTYFSESCNKRTEEVMVSAVATMSARPALMMCSSRSFSMGSMPLGTLSMRENIRCSSVMEGRAKIPLEEAAYESCSIKLAGDELL